jgi:hypothetical protein
MKSHIIVAAAIALAVHVQCAQVVAPQKPVSNVRNLPSVQVYSFPIPLAFS